MFSKVIDKLFKLPPVDRRWLPEKFAQSVVGESFRKDKDDTYIYWRMFCLGVFISTGFSILYLASYFLNTRFDLVFFSISVEHPDILRDVIFQYSVIVYSAVLFSNLIYGYILFRVNGIDIHNHDLMWWNTKAIRNSQKIKNFYKKALWFNVLIGYGSFGLPLFISGYYPVKDSLTFLVACMLILNAVFGHQSYYSFWLICVNYQRKHKLGPRFSNQSKSPVAEGIKDDNRN